MAKPGTSLLKSLALNVGIPSAAAVAGGIGGMAIGSNLAKKRMIGAFNSFNQQENRAIAQNFYEQGLSDAILKTSEQRNTSTITLSGGSMIDKQAYLENVSEAAFEDELTKLGVKAGAITRTARKALSSLQQVPGILMQSGKKLGKGVSGAVNLMRTPAGKGAKAIRQRKIMQRGVMRNLKAGIPAAATGAGVLGAAGIGTAAGINAMRGKKD